MSVSYKLRQYTSGILLLLLASFIIASVSYITSLIPENTILGNNTGNSIYTRLLLSKSWNLGSNTGMGEVLSNPISLNQSLYQYIMAVNSTAGYSGIKSICYNGSCYRSITQYNNSVAYLIIPSTASSLTSYGCESYSAGTFTLYIIECDRSANATDCLSAFFYSIENPTTTSPSIPTISNKLILSFISWIAGIILLIDALRRFDLEI